MPAQGKTRFDPERDLSSLNVRDSLEAAVRRHPDAPFLVWGSDVVTYKDFAGRALQAAAVWHHLGVRKGDRVAFMAENRPEFLEAWFGLAYMGAILVALNTRWQSAEVAQFLELTEPRLVLVSDAFDDVVAAAVSELAAGPEILPLQAQHRGRSFTSLLGETLPAAPLVPLTSDDEISFISTSGTTGRPKAVMQTHGNYVLTGEGYGYWLDIREGERIYVCLPLFHINAQAYSVMGAIAAGATIVLVERFSASRFWSHMVQYDIDVFNYIGSMLAVLLQRDPSPEERQHHVRVTYGGPAFPEPLRGEIERRFNLTLLSGIGMSETTFGLMEALHGERRSGSLGKARQHPDASLINEARVVDETDREVPRGQVGELVYRNPVQMKGYFRDPARTAETIFNGWLHTGDLVRQDTDGFFYFVDRKKDIIRVRGENVASAEVEATLAQHPDVREAAVVGVPSALTDDEIAAFVVLRAGAAAHPVDLVAWCRSRLAAFKVPTHVWVVPELPQTETLRVEKHRLRTIAVERLNTPPGGTR